MSPVVNHPKHKVTLFVSIVNNLGRPDAIQRDIEGTAFEIGSLVQEIAHNGFIDGMREFFLAAEANPPQLKPFTVYPPAAIRAIRIEAKQETPQERELRTLIERDRAKLQTQSDENNPTA